MPTYKQTSANIDGIQQPSTILLPPTIPPSTVPDATNGFSTPANGIRSTSTAIPKPRSNSDLNSFSFLNVHGLKPATVQSKVPYVSDVLNNQSQLFIGITETWLKSHKDAEIHIDGYRLFRADRIRKKKTARGRLSGGAAAYVRDDIASSIQKPCTFSNGVVELLCLYSPEENMVIMVVYRQPDDRVGDNRSTSHEFSTALNKATCFLNDLPSPTPNIIMGGDFNLPHVNWSSNSMGLGTSKDEKDIFESLSKFLDEHFLRQYVHQPTHIAGNTLDLVFTNNPDLIHSVICHPIIQSVSDHYIVECSTQFKSVSSKTEEIKPDHLSPLDRLNFFDENINWHDINNDLGSHNWDNEFEDLHPNEMLAKFMNVTTECCQKYIPEKKSSLKKNSSRIPRERRTLMRKRRQLVLKRDKCRNNGRKAEIERKLINVEILLQKSYKETFQMEEHRATSAIKSNPKYFFAYARKNSRIKSKIGPLLNERNQYTSSSKEMADLLKCQYETVFSSPMKTSVYSEHAAEAQSRFDDVEFTEEDVVEAINELSQTSSSGPDGIPAVYLKKCKMEIAKPLHMIWRKSLDLGITPTALLTAHIIPIHKGDHKGLAANYRPIALTSHLVKIFEKIVRTKMVAYLEENNLFNPTQHGFRHGRSCLSQLIAHYENILILLEKGLNVDTIYLDFAKAFDKVDHQVIIDKLAILGIGGQLLKWIQSFISNRTQHVLVNGFLSNPSEVQSGVPQGSVIGPLLFLILIADIDAELGSSFLSSFADDTRVSMGIESAHDASLLQADLEVIYRWAEANNMKFNSKKLEVLRYGFGTSHNNLKSQTSYTSPDGTTIEEKTVVRDLGIQMTNSAKFEDHINLVCEKAKDMSSWVLRTFRNRSPVVMKTLWSALVQPILDYCSQLWCPIQPGHIKRIEAIQQSFTRKIKLDQKVDYWGRLSSLRMYSQQRRRERYRILYIWKILEDLVPNISHGDNGGIRNICSPRNGRTCILPTLSRSSKQLAKLREASLSYHGSQLFNALPKEIRNITGCSVNVFKSALDSYLNNIDDKPLVTGYTASRITVSNSLIHMIPFNRRNQSDHNGSKRSSPELRR